MAMAMQSVRIAASNLPAFKMDSLRGVFGGSLNKDLQNHYRVAENNLKRKLDTLKKAEESELRLFQASKNRLKIKYSKVHSSGANSPSKSPANASNKFQRDVGERLVSGTSQNLEELYSQQLVYEMLFTNEEVDIEKLLCLHLLTMHVVRPRTYLSSAGSVRSRPPTAGQSAELRDRQSCDKGEWSNGISWKDARPPSARKNTSRSGRTSHTSARSRLVNKLLPCYVLNFLPSSEVGKCRQLSGSGTQSGSVCNAQCDALLVKSSADLMSSDSEEEGTSGLIMFVNKQLEALISFVMQILQQVNPVKVDNMVKLARNPSALVEMVKKPKSQQFLSFLKGKSITSSYSSFRKICRKVCISTCSPTESELPMKITPSAKHVLSLNMMFDDSLKMLRNVLTVVRRNIYMKKGFDKDKLAIMRPEEMANVNITKSFLEKKTSLLHSSASSRSNSTPFSASGTTAISMAADNSQSARSPERLSISGKTSSSERVAPEKQNMQTNFNNSRVSSKFQPFQTKHISNDQITNKTSYQSHDKLLQGASPKGANLYRQSHSQASNPDYLPKRMVVTAGEMGKRCAHEILDDRSSSQGRRDTQAQTCLTDAGDLDKQSARHSVASGQFQQSIANFRSQVLSKASTEPPATETVKFRGYNAAKLKVVITDKETDKKFEQYLRKTSCRKG